MAGIRRHYREASGCFEHPKKSLLKSSHPLSPPPKKKYLPNIPNQKTPRDRKFQTQKTPSIIHVTWNPEYSPPGTVIVAATFSVHLAKRSIDY